MRKFWTSKTDDGSLARSSMTRKQAPKHATALAFLLAFIWAANPAHANCRVIHMLDEMHTVQLRLLNNPDTRAFQSEIRLIRRHSDRLNTPLILNAIDASAFSRRGAAFLGFVNSTKQLLEPVSIDDPATVRAYFRDPSVAVGLQEIGSQLASLRCSGAEIAASELPVTEEEDFGAEIQEAAIKLLNFKNFVIAIIMLSAPIAALKAFQLWQSGIGFGFDAYRSKRETLFEFDGKRHDGILRKVSGTSAELTHQIDNGLAVGNTIVFKIGGRWTPGFVTWSDGSTSGIHFESRLSNEMVKRLRKKSAAQ